MGPRRTLPSEVRHGIAHAREMLVDHPRIHQVGATGTARKGTLGGSAWEEVDGQDVLLARQEVLRWASGVLARQDLLGNWEGALLGEDRCLGRNAVEEGVLAEVVLGALEVHQPSAVGGPYADPSDKFSDQGPGSLPAAHEGLLGVP